MEKEETKSKSTIPTLEQILSRLPFEKFGNVKERLLNAYIWGSRVYGNSTINSDWDIILITTAEQGGEIGFHQATKDIIWDSYDDSEFNISLLSVEVFMISLYEFRHEPIQLLFTPPEFVLKEQIKFELDIDYDVYRKTVTWESRQRLSLATSKFKKKYNSKASTKLDPVEQRLIVKDAVHCLRYLLFAIQIFTDSKISNYSCANEIFYKISNYIQSSPPASKGSSSSPPMDWIKEIESLRKSLVNQLKSSHKCWKIYNKISVRQRWNRSTLSLRYIPPHSNNSNNSNSKILPLSSLYSFLLELIGSFQNESSSEQKFETPLIIKCSENLPNVILVSIDRSSETIPNETKQIVGWVIEYNNNNKAQQEDEKEEECCWKLLARQEGRIEGVYDVITFENNLKSFFEIENEMEVKVNEKLDGVNIILYYYNNEWRISSEWELEIESLKLGMNDEIIITKTNNSKQQSPNKEEVEEQEDDSEEDDSEEKGIDMKQMFWRIWNKNGYKFPQGNKEEKEEEKGQNDKNKCFCFSLVTRKNRFSVKYDKDDLILYSVFNLTHNQWEFDITQYHHKYNFNTSIPVYTRRITSLQDFQNELATLKQYFKSLNAAETSPWRLIGYIFTLQSQHRPLLSNSNVMEKEKNRYKIFQVKNLKEVSQRAFVEWSYFGPVDLMSYLHIDAIDKHCLLSLIRANRSQELLSSFFNTTNEGNKEFRIQLAGMESKSWIEHKQQLKDKIETMQASYDDMCQEIEAKWSQVKHIEQWKNKPVKESGFGRAVNDWWCCAVLVELRKAGDVWVSVKEYLGDLHWKDFDKTMNGFQRRKEKSAAPTNRSSSKNEKITTQVLNNNKQ